MSYAPLDKTAKRLAPGSKRAGVLRTLLDRGTRGLNRFEAERACFDHVLPSTISELCRDFGLVIPRELETVPGHGGKPTECSRYRLSDDDAARVRRILNPEALPAEDSPQDAPALAGRTEAPAVGP